MSLSKLGFLILCLLVLSGLQLLPWNIQESTLLEAINIVILLTIIKLLTDGRKKNYIN